MNIKKKKPSISATPITICVRLLNALQAELHALCIVMRSGGECHQGIVFTSEEEGKFQSQTNALHQPTAHKIQTTQDRQNRSMSKWTKKCPFWMEQNRQKIHRFFLWKKSKTQHLYSPVSQPHILDCCITVFS